jgi:hypothetical protein
MLHRPRLTHSKVKVGKLSILIDTVFVILYTSIETEVVFKEELGDVRVVDWETKRKMELDESAIF